MFCAAIPAAAAVGAKINADQNRKPGAQPLPVGKITGFTILLLMVCSAVYHSLAYRP
jgi:hypothetical protein